MPEASSIVIAPKRCSRGKSCLVKCIWEMLYWSHPLLDCHLAGWHNKGSRRKTMACSGKRLFDLFQVSGLPPYASTLFINILYTQCFVLHTWSYFPRGGEAWVGQTEERALSFFSWGDIDHDLWGQRQGGGGHSGMLEILEFRGEHHHWRGMMSVCNWMSRSERREQRQGDRSTVHLGRAH